MRTRCTTTFVGKWCDAMRLFERKQRHDTMLCEKTTSVGGICLKNLLPTSPTAPPRGVGEGALRRENLKSIGGGVLLRHSHPRLGAHPRDGLQEIRVAARRPSRPHQPTNHGLLRVASIRDLCASLQGLRAHQERFVGDLQDRLFAEGLCDAGTILQYSGGGFAGIDHNSKKIVLHCSMTISSLC